MLVRDGSAGDADLATIAPVLNKRCGDVRTSDGEPLPAYKQENFRHLHDLLENGETLEIPFTTDGGGFVCARIYKDNTTGDAARYAITPHVFADELDPASTHVNSASRLYNCSNGNRI